jgi:hypothetical protein
MKETVLVQHRNPRLIKRRAQKRTLSERNNRAETIFGITAGLNKKTLV